jgi:hypothetical protein
MQTKLADVVAYICVTYPSEYRQDLSNSRLTKLVFLADWANARGTARQITDIEWRFNHYGPWVPDVLESVTNDDRFVTEVVENQYGATKRRVSLSESFSRNAGHWTETLGLTLRERLVLDGVIADTQSMYFGQFVDYVYDTYPVKHGVRFGVLDLVHLSHREVMQSGIAAEPIDFRTAGLDAVRYAAMRDGVAQHVARHLLQADISAIADPVQGFGHFSQIMRKPFIAKLQLEPEARVQRSSGTRWLMTVEGVLEVRGFVGPNQSTEPRRRAWLHVVDEDWSQREVLVSSAASCEFSVLVEGTDPKQWQFAVDSGRVTPIRS